jgi:galactokinase
MDQFASCLCRAEHALFLDCRSLACEWIPLRLAGWRVVIANSGEGRELAGSAYNERRAQCEAAVAVLAEADPAVTALRDASSGALERARGRMDAVAYRRARHVVSENERVLAAVEALRAGDLGAFGALMSASHDSLRDDYEVSSPALDGLVEAAREVEGCAGSRLTGAGFGGCTVSLVRAERVEAFREQVAGRYRAAFGRPPRFYTTRAAPGAGIIPADEG